MDGWIGECMDGWMGGNKTVVNDWNRKTKLFLFSFNHGQKKKSFYCVGNQTDLS